MTEFLIVFPVLLLMMSCVVFFGRLLVLKERTVTAARYAAWYSGRHNTEDPTTDTIKSLFFKQESRAGMHHPDPSVGFAGNSLGTLGDVLGYVAGIKGTAIEAEGDCYPFSKRVSHMGAQHFVFLDTWDQNSVVGQSLKYGLWAIAVAKGFKSGDGGSSGESGEGGSSFDLSNPSILGK